MAGRTIYTLLVGTLAERPTTAEEGRCYLAYDERLFYRYLGGQWVEQPIFSAPPSGKYKVTQLYVDPATNTLVIEYDDTPVP